MNLFTTQQTFIEPFQDESTINLIDGILKIHSLGDNFEQVHNLYTSDSTWSTACQMLDAWSSQSASSVVYLFLT